MSHPNIVMVSQFSPSYSSLKFGRYLGYMDRKQALESKGKLDQPDKQELKLVTEEARKLDVHGRYHEIYISNKDSPEQAKAKTFLNEKNLSELSEEEFGRYLGYMDRVQALAKKKDTQGLSNKEEKELSRVSNAVRAVTNKRPTKDKVLIGGFTSEQEHVQLKDFEHIRDKLNTAQANGSSMWKDVVSFDNDFLAKHGIYDPKTGELNEAILQRATRKMMDTFAKEMDPPLYKPFWNAAIHRNTDNIHIHIACVEEENHRPIIKRPKMMRDKDTGKLVKTKEYVYQAKGRRPQSLIDKMKFAFGNELIDTSELTKEISKHRAQIKKAVKQTMLEKVNEPTFQSDLNKFVTHLPESRRNWNYAWLKKHDKEGQKQLDHLTEYLLKDNPEYKKYKKEVQDYQNNREEMFGKSKRKTKNYAVNRLKEIKQRNGNALLAEVAKYDKQANKYRKKIPPIKDAEPKHYIQSVLKELQKQNVIQHQLAYRREQNYQKKVAYQKKQHQKRLYKEAHPFLAINKRQQKNLQRILNAHTNKELARIKAGTSYRKSKALNEHERLQKEIEMESL